MSTTFDVLPGSSRIPTFEELLALGTHNLHVFLERHGVNERPRIDVQLLRCTTNDAVPFALGHPLRWADDTYAWFTVGPVAGGTDAYFLSEGDDWRASWEDELRDRPQSAVHAEAIRHALAVRHRWSFRRSAGQPCVINVTYGLLAAALAELTGGLVYSDDSAWDYERFPARPEEVMSWYFEPKFAIGADFRKWSERCLASLADELRP